MVSSGWVRFGIAVGLLGGIVLLIGLFPQITGIEPTPGVGIVKITTILIGYSTFILGALIFVQSAFYPKRSHTLWQEIGVRLSLTGLVVSAFSAYADVLGYGSNPPEPGQRPILGIYQTTGLVGGFLIAALGVLIFALSGDRNISPPLDSEEGQAATISEVAMLDKNEMPGDLKPDTESLAPLENQELGNETNTADAHVTDGSLGGRSIE